MKKFLCYDTNDAVSGKVPVNAKTGVLTPSTINVVFILAGDAIVFVEYNAFMDAIRNYDRTSYPNDEIAMIAAAELVRSIRIPFTEILKLVHNLTPINFFSFNNGFDKYELKKLDRTENALILQAIHMKSVNKDGTCTYLFHSMAIFSNSGDSGSGYESYYSEFTTTIE